MFLTLFMIMDMKQRFRPLPRGLFFNKFTKRQKEIS